MEVEVYDTEKDKVGERQLTPEIFDADVREHLFWEVVRWQRANRRAGTHSTKSRSDVRGGGKKPWAQKGTGRARHGSNRSPIWVGGGVIDGPEPRDHGYSIPKTKRREALKSALSMKLDSDQLFVLDSIEFPEVKTKKALEMLETFGSEEVLIVDTPEEWDKSEEDGDLSPREVFLLSIRNLPDVKHLPARGLNVEDILNYELLLMTEAALDSTEERLSDGE